MSSTEQQSGTTGTKNQLSNVGQLLLLLSGKGGVGKSTLTVQLACALASRGKRVGVLDIDLCGPSIGLMFGLSAETTVMCGQDGWQPITCPKQSNIKLMSIAFLLKNESSAVIWRGPKKHAMIRQFLTEVAWGELDFLLVDTPPGTSDEHISIVETLRQLRPANGALLITTPQAVSVNDVRREIAFCRKASLPIAGLLENMSGYVCSNCKECTNIFSSGGGASLAEYAQIPFLGSIPIDSKLTECMETGDNYVESFTDSDCAKQLISIADKLIETADGAYILKDLIIK